MIIQYRLEIYFWDKDYWKTVGYFLKKEDAEKMIKDIENQNEKVMCNIFEVVLR